MKKYLKFLKKLPKGLREKLIKVVLKIAEDNLKGLDVKRIVSNVDFYRCRVGKIRILFEKKEDGNYIHDIGFRGGIYD